MKKELEKALECCVYCLCNECTYQKYDDYDYPIKCIRKLVVDLYEEIKKKGGGEKMGQHKYKIYAIDSNYK